jgi:hypothetical protein
MGLGGHKLTHSNQTPNTVRDVVGVSPRGIISAVKRETAQTAG